LAWDKSYICNNNPSFGGTGGHKPQEDYVAAPNLDHGQERVRKDITAWMKWLRNNVGFDGWRFDFVKGYGTCCCCGASCQRRPVAAHTCCKCPTAMHSKHLLPCVIDGC